MSCRCKAIKKAKKDLEKLLDAISELADGMEHYRTIVEYHSQLLDKQRETFYLYDSEFAQVNSVIKSRDEDIETQLQDYKDKLLKEVRDLRDNISDMEAEDDDYHSDDD